ncbi:ThuA domain-containing protein [bacterium]|nr:ThuA domain-containing protein [bacterium]
MLHQRTFPLALAILSIVLWTQGLVGAEPLRLLFLGDHGHHQPAARAEQLVPVLARRGIHVEFTTDVDRLRPAELDRFQGLIIYANIEKITVEQEESLLQFVDRGGALVALHCASYCFLNSEPYIALVGAQFQKHETGTFSTLIAEPDHPVMKGFAGFESWDETYVHHHHHPKDRTVLEYRLLGVQADGQTREPWTWVRTQGKGRVFYTAWGHDERTWSHAGFHQLVERGIRWACRDESTPMPLYRDPQKFDQPTMTSIRTDVEPFEYVEIGAKIPNYTPNANWGTQGKPITTMQKPLSPEESVKHFVTPSGLSMKLFASEKDLAGKPIAMNWDEKGRLWLAVTTDYPNDIVERGAGNDKVQLLEDTNRDGVADRTTIFADRLNLPTSLVSVMGGVIVQNGTETLFLKDTDGDGKADVRVPIITGWAMGDTHGGVNNLRYGPDNWIWGMQGYNQSEPTVAGKKLARFQMGFFRFKLEPSQTPPHVPRVTAIEFLRSTYGNTWGLGFSEEGLVFGSSANGHPSLFMPIANRYYERVRGWTPSLLAASIAESPRFSPITDKVRQVDHHGNYSAAAGHALYTARAYPSLWWNKTAFVCGPEGHLVGTFHLKPKGAGFQSSSPCNLLASDDEWSAPIMAEVGPDGFVWIIDWYNYIVQHNPTPLGFENGKGNAYVTDLRDKTRGRVYRLVADQSTAGFDSTPAMLDENEPRSLLAGLRHPTMFCRLEAQRLLVSRRKKDVVPDLIAMARDPAVDAIGLNVGAMHALWTLAGLGETADDTSEAFAVASEGFRHASPGVRRAAVTVLPPSPRSVERIVSSGILADSDPQVRLAGLLALADTKSNPGAGEKLASLALESDMLKDIWLREAFISASAMHGDPFLRTLLVSSDRIKLDAQSLSMLAEAVAIVAEHVARTGLDQDATNRLLASVQTAAAPFADALVIGLVKGWSAGKKMALDASAESALLNVFPNMSLSGRASVIRLGEWTANDKLRSAADELIRDAQKAFASKELSMDARLAAAAQLIRLRLDRPESVATLLTEIGPQSDPAFVQGVFSVLRESTSNELGERVLAKLGTYTPVARQHAIRLLLTRTDTTRELLQATEKGSLDLSDLLIDQRQSLTTHPDKMIAARAKRVFSAGGGLPSLDRVKVLEELMPVTEETGDVARGKLAFKTHCAKCHQHGDMGENVGPNLTGMAVHPKKEILLHILDPSQSVETNYRAYTVTSLDGRVRTGLLSAESKTTIEMVDADGKRVSIPREDIDEIVASKKSFMPEGFEKQMKREEFVDLLEFMAARGKYTPLDLRPVASIVSTKGMFTAESAEAERLIFDNWSPKTVDGVPYLLVDPKDGRIPNVVMLKGDLGEFPPRMPTSVVLPVHQPVKKLHFLSGVGGWSFPATVKGTVSMIVRLHYSDQRSEDHTLENGVHFADYIRRVDVPGSKFAFALRGQQIRTFSVEPKRADPIDRIELIKGPDPTSPVVMAITAEAP